MLSSTLSVAELLTDVPFLGRESVCKERTQAGTRFSGRSHLSGKNAGICKAGEKSAPQSRGALINSRNLPILVFDVMDTIVTDPFYTVVPQFFGMTMEELLKVKHPKTWLLFERGMIDEKQMMDEFFADGRDFDRDGLLQTMREHYEYIAHMEELLNRLKSAGYEMHACSNYPSWYKLIEDKLKLSTCLDWTFLSCEGPMKGYRKPDMAVYNILMESLGANPEDVILVDDREANIEGALEVGMDGICFKSAQQLDAEFQKRGLVY